MNKHIAIYIPSMKIGGAEKVALTLANEFAERDYRIDLLLTRAQGVLLQNISQKVNIINFDSDGVFKSIIKLKNYLEDKKPEILYSLMTHVNIAAILANILANNKSKIIACEHSTLSVNIKNTPTAKRFFIRLAVKYLYKYASKIIAVSNGVSKDLIEYANIPKSKINVVYNPVVTNDLYNTSNIKIDHEWVSNKTNIPLILSVGRFIEAKDFKNLLNAFSIVSKKIQCKLVILGDGELRKSLENLVIDLHLTNSVLLPGFSSEVYAWMRSSSLFVLSSKYEGLSNVLIEAMACGTPVVSTNCPSGPAEILENGLWGKLVPVGDSVALASAIIDSLKETNHPDVVIRAENFEAKHAIDGYLKSAEIQ